MNDLYQWREASRRFSEISRQIQTLWKRRMAQNPRRDSPAFVSRLNALHAEQRKLWTSERKQAREKYVLEMRAAGKTLREISLELGVTVERVRQIQGGAERKLRRGPT